MKTAIFTLLLLGLTLTLRSQIVYVTPDGAGLKDGSSWINALDGNFPSGNGYTKLADAMRMAASGKQFWIAEGTYKACSDNDREKSFELGQNIKLFGGFQGTESDTIQRNIGLYPTIFSGDIGQLNDSTDNTKIILKTIPSSWIHYSFIDGIGFELAYNNASYGIGVGIYNTGLLLVTNCNFFGNISDGEGAGVQNSNNLHVEKCVFQNNRASEGGGIYNSGTTIVTYSKFSNNYGGYQGGGIGNRGGLTVINSLIVNNNGGNAGGISSWFGASTNIYNSTLANNTGDLMIFWGQVTVFNTIIWGGGLVLWSNPTVNFSHSVIQNYTANPLVYSENPSFINPSAGCGASFNGLEGNWGLRWCSPIINMGDNNLIPADLTTDLNGNPRIGYATVEPGAYEFDSTGNVPNGIGFINNRIYVSDSNAYIGDGSSWASALAGNAESCKYPGQTLLYEAMKEANPGTEVWVKKGTYTCSLSNNRNHAFNIGSGVKVIGSFAGNEASTESRNTTANHTVLSGNIGDGLIEIDNSYHVMNINPQEIEYADSAALDGVIIEKGYADGASFNSEGAGILVHMNSKFKIENSVIRKNRSSGNGSGIKLNTASKISMHNCKILDNEPLVMSMWGQQYSSNGAGIYNEGNLKMTGCSVVKNNNAARGSGIYNADSLVLINCSVDTNICLNTYQPHAMGGGILNAGYCNIRGGTVNGNQTYTRGGGISNNQGAVLCIDNAIFSGNSCGMAWGNSYGGGIYTDGNMLIKRSDVSNNTAMDGAGGIYVGGSASADVSQTTIAFNVVTSGSGGGLLNGGTLLVNGCKISNNEAGGNGGGVYNPTMVRNSIIVNNKTGYPNYQYYGGGIVVGNGCQGIYNSTIANNLNQGIASSDSDTLIIRNCIVYGNEVQLSGHYTISNSCVTEIFPDSSNMIADPLWVNPSSGKGPLFNGIMANWELGSYSRCINNGDNSVILLSDSLDANGLPRKRFGTIDIGGAELQVPTDSTEPQLHNVVCEIFRPKPANIQTTIAVPWESTVLTSLETPLPYDLSTQSRIRGYILPPANGYYRFYLASDYGGKFFLSSDSLENNRRIVCSNDEGNTNWPYTLGNIDSVYLESGKPYYFESFCWNAAFAWNWTLAQNYIKIGWTLPNRNQLQLITGEFLKRANPKQELSVDWEIFKNNTSYDFSFLRNSDSIPDLIIKLDSLNTKDNSTLLDHFSSRIRGYLVPPVSGNYSFYFACDNVGQFWLSTDTNVVNAQLKSEISAIQTDWTQNSSTQTLVAGQKYFFEILHYDTVYTDLVKLGWKIPGDTMPVVIRTPYITSCGENVAPDNFSFMDDHILSYPNWAITPSYRITQWNASNKSIQWESLNQAIATVSPYGVITTLSPGLCHIKASLADSPFITDTLEVVVTDYYGPYFVKENAPENGNGHTWDTAIRLDKLLDFLNRGLHPQRITVFVSKGTYKPTTTIDQNKTFTLNNIRLVGGFNYAATGSDTTSRDFVAHETILSGEIGAPGETLDNCYHVVVMQGNSVIDGFTIRDGRATCSTHGFTLGISTYKRDDNGGGILSESLNSTIINCKITNNSAWNGGGGINCFAWWGEPAIVNMQNCSIYSNRTQQTLITLGGVFELIVNANGAGIKATSCTLNLTGCNLYDNFSKGHGGAVFLESATTNIDRCSFYQNSSTGTNNSIYAKDGSGIIMDNSTVKGEVYCFFYPSATIRNSTIIGSFGSAFCYSKNAISLDNTIVTDFNPYAIPVNNANALSDTCYSAKYCILGNSLFGASKENVISDSIQQYPTWLDTLAYNGGYTPTAKLKSVPNNPTKSNGNLLYLGTTDQRGALRIDSVSIGAYQYDFPNTGIVEVKAFPEGLYNASTHSLTKSRNASGEQFGGAIADNITLELHEATSPFNLIGTTLSANLLTTGYAHSMATAPLPDSFYIVLKHRNSLETWSSSPVTPTNGLVKYDFTQQLNSAYGNNLKPIGSYFGLFSGDANQDGVLDELDINQIGNKANIFGVGYIPEDLNGDGTIDALDMILLDNNAVEFIEVEKP